MFRKTVSEVIVDVLVQAGAKRCYGIVGDTINHLTNVIRSSELEWINVRHEEAGAFAAGGESYLTRELSVCAGTTGPGSLHFINGIFESHRNGSPVLLIASNIDRAQQGLNFIQEVDQKTLYGQCSVFCEYISHPEQARRITVQAAQAALNKKGVAVVIVNGDMFKETTSDELAWSVHRAAPLIMPNSAELDRLVQLIESSTNITLYGGIGCRNAHDQVVALSQKLKAPVVHTSRAKEFLEYGNPYNIGMNGVLGNHAGVRAVMEADLLICLGTDFAYTQFYPDKTKIVQIDHDVAHIGRRSPVQLGLVGDVAVTIDALLPRLEQRHDSGFVDGLLAAYKHDWQENLARTESHHADLIHPQTVAHLLDRLASEDAAFTADGGSPMVWLLRHIRANGKRSFLLSLLHGTMANAFPQAIGIAKAFQGRQVIALCGDGGLTMLMGDLLTLVQEDIPVKLLVFNNGSLGFVDMEQRVEGMLSCFTQLKNPNFAELAKVCGIHGERVENLAELEPAMGRWLAVKGPALLDIKINPIELVMPSEVKAENIAGVALYALKAVFSGQMSELNTFFKNNFQR